MEELDLVTPTCEPCEPCNECKIHESTQEDEEREVYMRRMWHKRWLANYKYETDEAKECKNFIKETYKNDVYLPWAFMERVFYTQDPNAWIDTPSISYNTYEIKTIQNGVETLSTIVSPTIFVQGSFMGKLMSEYYPVQDKDYSAPRAINQNMLNKAYQRAKTRLISRLTGIGWSLYETGDLQFEDDGAKHETPTPKAKTTVNPVPEPKIDITEPQEIKPYSAPEPKNDVLDKLVDLIKNSEKTRVEKALINFNPSLSHAYGFTLSIDDTESALEEKISKVKNKEKFLLGLESLINNA